MQPAKASGAAELTREEMLARSHARDAEYDGVFLVGVLSTGIYCLPSCPARSPKPENVRFFDSIEAVRAAGLRPCKRCRPDDLYAGRDPESEMARQLRHLVSTDPVRFRELGTLCSALGIGATRLHVLCREQFHTTPGALLQRLRVAAACSALLAGPDKVLDVAFAVGFDSLSAFQEAFLRRVGTTPGAYRRLGTSDRFELRLPAGFRAVDTLAFHGRDAESPTERVAGRNLARAALLDGVPSRLEIALAPSRAACRVVAARPVSRHGMAQAHAIVRRLLGLDLDPAPWERRRHQDPLLAKLVADRLGLRIPQTVDAFEGFVWSVVGQQVGLGFAYRLRRTLIERAGTPVPGGLVAHPTPAAAAELDTDALGRAGFSRRKAATIVDVAARAASGMLALDALADEPAPAVERKLLELPGIGPWAANYVMLRALGFADCVPVGDAGLRRALVAFHGLPAAPTVEETRRLMAPFAPYRSLATTHLWSRLGAPT